MCLLIIEDCEFAEICLIEIDYQNKIEIRGDCRVGKLKTRANTGQRPIIPEIKILNGKIDILNLVFVGDLIISGGAFVEEFHCSEADHLIIEENANFDCDVNINNLKRIDLRGGLFFHAVKSKIECSGIKEIEIGGNNKLEINGELVFGEVGDLTINDGAFGGEVNFHGDKFNSIHFKGGKFDLGINFNSVTISQKLVFSGGDFQRITIDKSKSINGFLSFGKKNFALKIEQLVISDSSINNAIVFNNGKIDDISFYRSHFKQTLTFGNEFKVRDDKKEPENLLQEERKKLSINSLKFAADNIFESTVTFKKPHIIESLEISGGTYKENFKFLQANCLNEIKALNITGGTFEKEFEIYTGTFEKIKISGGQFKDGLKMWGGTFGEVKISGGDFKEQEINIGPITKNAESSPNFEKLEVDLPINFNLKIQNSACHDLILRNRVLSDGIVSIQNTVLNRLHLNNLENRGDITFREIRAKEQSQDSSVKIINSNLLKTYFINFYFHEFEKIYFEGGVNLLEMSLINSDIPVKKLSAESHQNKTNVFNQLYHVAERLKNKKLEQEYFSAYLNGYHKELYVKKGEGCWEKTARFFNKDRIVLWFNRISTDFGQSWPLGILFTFIMAIIFFLLYFWSLQKFVINGNLNLNLTKEGVENFIEYFVNFLNPTRKPYFFEKEYEFSISGMSLLIDLFARIFIGYGIYQTVAAFRRLGKR